MIFFELRTKEITLFRWIEEFERGLLRKFNVHTFLPNKPRQRRIIAGSPLLTLTGNSLIANKVFPFTAKYLKRVEVIKLANVVSSNQFRQISFFKCKTA
jgi:hypothetical protein